MKQTFKTSTNLNSKLKLLQHSDLKKNPTSEDAVAVEQLLHKHVTDYKEKYQYLKVGEFSDQFIKNKLNQQMMKDTGVDTAEKKRRRQLINKFKMLKKI